MYDVIEVIVLCLCCLFGVYMAKKPEQFAKSPDGTNKKKVMGIVIAVLTAIIAVLQIITMIKK